MISWNKALPNMLNMKYIRSNKANTFSNAGRENCIVESKAWRPLYLLRSLNSLDTRNTRRILASCGPTLKNFKLVVFIYARIISAEEEATTKKSNTFQLLLK